MNLLVRPAPSPADPDLITEVTPALAGWEFIHFQARRLDAGGSWRFDTGEHELALVALGGSFHAESSRGSWRDIGGRATVFAGPPHALYLPRDTALTLSADAPCTFAAAWVRAEQAFAPRRITPADVGVELRGGDNASRQINSIIPPGFPCQRLVVVEVYTPGGNWSSYPPHKHDVHRVSPDGTLLEADLEEIYFYQHGRAEGYAIQRVYSDDRSLDELVTARHNEVVLVPAGYHPVTAPPGYTTYYLNVLAGSAQSLANSDDPAFAWVKDTYTGLDPRVPLY